MTLFRSAALHAVLDSIPDRVIACSGGIDSLLLAYTAHRASPAHTWVAHAVSPAVPSEATARVKYWAKQEGWQLALVDSGEFADENYLRNPVNRCYYCKRNLYGSLHRMNSVVTSSTKAVVFSGANLDDLGEYRPGLIAASENGVRHPFIEAKFTKQDIRDMARHAGLPFADLPASPCLSSRLYTGTRVTAQRLRAVEAGEALIRQATGLAVVRCRIRDNEVLVETPSADRHRINPALIEQLSATMRAIDSNIMSVSVDALPYKSGRAFLIEKLAAT